jgi:hypothetical protein
MKNLYLTTAVDPDGSLTLPAIATRTLGCAPGDEVRFAIPDNGCPDHDPESSQTLPRNRRDGDSNRYTTDGENLNIPASRLAVAGIPPGSEISVLAADGALVIAAAANGLQRDLTDELSCFLQELGYDPETVDTTRPLLS